MKRLLLPLLLLSPWLVASSGAAPAGRDFRATEGKLPRKWLSAMPWRSIGPAAMGGRITDLAVHPRDPAVFWVATASGGILKTTDGGITFEHRFDTESTVSIGAVAVAPSNPDIVWVGTGEANPRNSVSFGDGVYKSTDGGKTWRNMGLSRSFQIGAVVVHPKNPDIVYVGALGRLWGPGGERGLYKTTDGGRTWERILFVDENTGVVDVAPCPADPDTLLVAAWERRRDGFDTNDPAKKVGPGSGLYKTTDGGKTFRKITKGLPTCDLGRIGLAFAPSRPEVVYAVVESAWTGAEPPDAPYMGILGGDADAGARLTQVLKGGPAEKAGLKAGDIVLRVGDRQVLSYADLVRAARLHTAGETVKVEVVRDHKSLFLELTFGHRPGRKDGEPPSRRRSMFAAGLGGQRENLQEQQGPKGLEYGGLYRSEDAGETFTRINTLNPRPMYFSEVRVDPADEKRVWVLGINLWKSVDAGKTFTPDGARGVHVDHHALWIDPRDGRHMILGNDGGLYVTRDRGAHWDHLNQVAIGQFYDVAVGPRRDYRVYGGLQDNGCWGGPSVVRHGRGPANADWFRIGGGDGFRCRVDPDDPDLVYFEMQYGGMGRRNLRTGERGAIRPRAPRGTRYRFNWNTPFLLSHFNARIFYCAGNRVFRSLDRGRGLRAISPEITATDRGSATALAESPLDPDELMVGTDDGALWITRDGGHAWTDLFRGRPAEKPGPADAARAARVREMKKRLDENGDGKIELSEVTGRIRDFLTRADSNHDGVVDDAELAAMGRPRGKSGAAGAGKAKGKRIADLVPHRRWVSWIEFSRFAPGRAYLTFDGHRSDDDRPLLFVTEDHGATWRSLRANLPDSAGPVRVLREDLVNEDVLYLGTEFGAFVSIDRGASWTSLNTNLPTVAVHAFAIHPTAGEIVAATHGRSLWVLDVSALRQIDEEALSAPVRLYRPTPAVRWRSEPWRGSGRTFTGENPPFGAVIYYSLGRKAESPALEITTLDGKHVRSLEASGEAGLHRVIWDLRGERPKDRRGRFRRGPLVRPGTYRVILTAAGERQTADLEVQPDG